MAFNFYCSNLNSLLEAFYNVQAILVRNQILIFVIKHFD